MPTVFEASKSDLRSLKASFGTLLVGTLIILLLLFLVLKNTSTHQALYGVATLLFLLPFILNIISMTKKIREIPTSSITVDSNGI